MCVVGRVRPDPEGPDFDPVGQRVPLEAAVTGGGYRWWLQVVVTGGGYRWSLQVMVTGDGCRWWLQVVATARSLEATREARRARRARFIGDDLAADDRGE